jgi:aminoglycoside phosphotransferase (APT) family kinase protein
VLAAVDDLARSLTPSPVGRAEAGSVGTARVVTEPWWANLAADPPPGLDDWSARHSPRLAEIQHIAPAAAARGDTLLHLDLRADNVLVARDRIFFVDWPHARIGSPWVDVVFMAPSVTMQGGPPPQTLLAGRASAQDVDAESVTSVIVAVAGFFTYLALQPPPPGLPTLRAFQAAQATVAREWVAQRTGLH